MEYLHGIPPNRVYRFSVLAYYLHYDGKERKEQSFPMWIVIRNGSKAGSPSETFNVFELVSCHGATLNEPNLKKDQT